MITTGAYSKKYQAVEKEKMRELKDKEKRLFKERATYLSIQTSQRQRAMEEKKRAMLEAEEERRKKALEDRRRSQQQATDRFRSTIGRMRLPKNSFSGRSLSVLAKSKNTKCSHAHQNPSLFQMESVFDRDRNNSKGSERLTTGKEVEIVADKNISSLHKKTPSLDDVLDQLKVNEAGQCELSDVDINEHAESTTDVHTCVPNDPATFTLIKRKSASDTNLNCVQSPPEATAGSKARYCLSESADHSTRIEDYETKIFHPANNKPETMATLKITPNPPTYSGAVEDDICNSPTIPDSLNSSIAEPMRELEGTINNAFEESATPTKQHGTHTPEKCKQQPCYVCVEDSDTSTIDSLEEGSSNTYPPRSRFQTGVTPQQLSCDNKPAVVGILKKSNRSYSVPSAYYSRSRYPVEAPYSRHNSCETLDEVDNGNPSKLQKRVRFSDQLETSEKSSNPIVMNIADSVQIELWKRVFPEEFSSQSVRNSAFTPKMKCSLSSKTASVPKSFRRPLNGSISVHVPAADIEEYVAPTKARCLNSNVSSDYPSRCDESAHNMEVKDLTDTDSNGTGIEPAANRSLEKTPTDTEINTMWDQIRQCLQDGRKMPVPPRVFNFKPPTENGRRTLTNSYNRTNDSTASPSLSAPRSLSTNRTAQSSNIRRNNMNYATRKHLVYRQPNQTGLTRHTDTQPRSTEVTTHYAVPVRQEAPSKNRLLSGIQPSSKEPAKSSGSSNTSTVALSLEEQRLMQSIERINQRLKDHLLASDAPDFSYSPVPPSTPPKRLAQPSVHTRARILSEPSTRNKLPRAVGTLQTVNSGNHSNSIFPFHKSSHIT